MAARTIVTLAQFQQEVFYRLGNAVFWNTSEVTKYINTCLRFWNAMTGYWHTRTLITTVANRPYYSLPATLVFGAHVEFNGVPITQGSVFGWDQMDPHWEASRGTPEEWSPVGIGIIAIRPVDPIGANRLLVDGVTNTPTLSAPGDYIDLGQDVFAAMLDYIQHIASFKEGGAEFASTQTLYQQFLECAGTYNEKLRASSLYRRAMGLDEDKQLKVWKSKPQMNSVGMR